MKRMKLTSAEVALIEERRRLDAAFNAGLDAALRAMREWTAWGIGAHEVDAAIASINASERKEVL